MQQCLPKKTVSLFSFEVANIAYTFLNSERWLCRNLEIRVKNYATLFIDKVIIQF